MKLKNLVLGSTLAGMIVIVFLCYAYFQLTPQPSNRHNTPLGNQKAVLKLSGYVSEEYWSRNSVTDLPDCVNIIQYFLSNTGLADASNVTVAIYVAGHLFNTTTIQTLTRYESYSDSFSTKTVYDSSCSVEIQASCNDSSDSVTFPTGSDFPRYWTARSTLELFITPKEATLSRAKDEIVKNKLVILPNWIALRDWVGNNIKYKDDEETHGVSDFWQLPKETLSTRSGDCEDFSILLCSLLRADGTSPNDVYVVLGKKDNAYHAWVKVDLGFPLGWQNIEPQANGWSTLVGDFVSLSGYDAICYFNDLQYHEVR
jgi:hypothetical protein